MTNRRQWLDKCLLEFPNRYEDYPFDELPGGPGSWAVLLDGSLPEEEVLSWIHMSYDLTGGKCHAQGKRKTAK